ncbi:MAG: ATP-dependent Clp protease ATP-binding subunit [Candidatus Moraniibacteriota bacterium]
MNFLTWHYTEGTRKLLEIWRNYAEFFWWYFGIGRHFRTLFSSWKRDISRVGRPGFHPVLLIQSALENIVTRFFGSLVRAFVILFGLISEMAVLLLLPLILLIWLLWPLFLLTGIGIFFSLDAGSPAPLFLESLSFILALGLILISFRAYLAGKKNLFVTSWPQVMDQEWFARVWERIGKEPSTIDQRLLADPNALNNFLRSCDMTPEEFEKLIAFEAERQAEKEEKRKFWDRKNLYDRPAIGESWTYAYTVNLDRYSTDLSEGDPTDYRNSKLVGRSEELDMLELILTRPSQNSALIIGEAGVGKRTVVHSLAEKIRKRKAVPYLLGKRVLEISLGEIFSGMTQKGQVEDVLRSMFFEAAYAGNIILVIDSIGHFLSSNPQNPGENISAVLEEFLAAPTFQVIGLADTAEFHENIEKKEALTKYFEKVQLEEMNSEQTLAVLLDELEKVEGGKIIFTYQGLREIVKLSERYITDSPFPEKALDLLEETLLFWSQSSVEPFISPQTVDEVVSKKIKVPLGEMQSVEQEKMINLEEILHQRVIGQKFAIKQIAETMRRARVGMASATKPIGSFLFLGPTGVGKTESAKSLAAAYFGDEKRMIRLDMSEYQGVESLDRLLGSVEINMTGQLTNKVKENPYALLLLDEIEKAHPSILDLFLQILDEGWVTDAFGKKINFRNLIIIATSNAGSTFIKEAVESGMEAEVIQGKLVDYVIRENIFRPEFLNRFEGVIFFHPLNREEILKIAQLQLLRYSAQLKRVENIDIQFDPEITNFIVEKGYERKFGARSIDRFIQDKIGDKVVKKMISQEIRKGDQFMFKLSDILEE